MPNTEFAAIILAAGKGTRMKSSLHKVLHPVGGKPMVTFLLETVESLSPAKTLLVVGSGKDQLVNALPDTEFPNVGFVEQIEQLGTGHAAKIATQSLGDFYGDITKK